MQVFFISDCHFDHYKIIEYTERPFNTVLQMNSQLMWRWNKRVKPDDLVYHVGDFAFKGANNAQLWEKRLNGNIVHIQGNHDKNNGVKTYIVKCIMHFGGKSVFVEHRPPHSIGEIPYGVDFCICGHVHHHYKHKWVGNVPVINVSVDVWDYEPVSVHMLLKYYRRIKNEKH